MKRGLVHDRPCETCGASLRGRGNRARYCAECGAAQALKRRRQWQVAYGREKDRERSKDHRRKAQTKARNRVYYDRHKGNPAFLANRSRVTRNSQKRYPDVIKARWKAWARQNKEYLASEAAKRRLRL